LSFAFSFSFSASSPEFALRSPASLTGGEARDAGGGSSSGGCVPRISAHTFVPVKQK
jgi:hypothetical protein